MKYPALVAALVALVLAMWPTAAGAQQITVGYGGVVQLAGTPHIWVSEGGQLHWAGDTRALAGRYVNWGERHVLNAQTIRTFTIGDPWLSTGLMKWGDPIYLVKWETGETQPRLLHIQSIQDVELFGITGSNYGRFVIDQPEWERRTGLRASVLTRATLERAVPVSTTVAPTPTVAPPAASAPVTGGAASGSQLYRLRLTRVDDNAYRDDVANLYVLTSLCLELALSSEAILEYSPTSLRNQVTFTRGTGRTCAVRLVSPPNATLTRTAQDVYEDQSTRGIVLTRYCYEYVYGVRALVTTDRVYFSSSSCERR